MRHKRIVITVTYDDAHPVPSNDNLKANVHYAVQDGLLSPIDCGVVDVWDVKIEDSTRE